MRFRCRYTAWLAVSNRHCALSCDFFSLHTVNNPSTILRLVVVLYPSTLPWHALGLLLLHVSSSRLAQPHHQQSSWPFIYSTTKVNNQQWIRKSILWTARRRLRGTVSVLSVGRRHMADKTRLSSKWYYFPSHRQYYQAKTVEKARDKELITKIIFGNVREVANRERMQFFFFFIVCAHPLELDVLEIDYAADVGSVWIGCGCCSTWANNVHVETTIPVVCSCWHWWRWSSWGSASSAETWCSCMLMKRRGRSVTLSLSTYNAFGLIIATSEFQFHTGCQTHSDNFEHLQHAEKRIQQQLWCISINAQYCIGIFTVKDHYKWSMMIVERHKHRVNENNLLSNV